MTEALLQDGRKTRHQREVAAPEHRQAWAMLTPEEMSRPGAVLLGWLLRAANERDMNLQELATNLGVSYAYIGQLRSGIRQVKGAGGQFLTACATFLRVPRIAVMIAADVVGVEDFYDSPDQFAAELDAAITFIGRDETFGAFMPVDLPRASLKHKAFVVLLYQQATSKKLLNAEVDLASIFTTVEEHRSLTAG
jgi:transcriptional regulator with XRE-family HTH domain